MRRPIWVERRVLLMLHQESLAEHGGASGLRDEGLLDSALLRPLRKFECEPLADIADLAASYAWGLTRNQAFVDGNKRVALVACGLLLSLNRWELRAERIELTLMFLRLAEGSVEESELAAWLRAKIGKRRK